MSGIACSHEFQENFSLPCNSQGTQAARSVEMAEAGVSVSMHSANVASI